MNNKEPRVPKFIDKLVQILNNPTLAHIIAFNEEGDGIVVHDEQALCTLILPNFFRQHQFDSFARQMNNYGFRRVRNIHNKYEFRNPDFQRDRKYNKNSQKKQIKKFQFLQSFNSLKQELTSYSNQLTCITTYLSQCQQSINGIRESQSRLQQEIQSIAAKREKNELMIHILLK